MLRLHVVPAQGEPFDHPLGDREIIVGRSSQCDLTIADRFLSRRHARVFPRNGGWAVEDLGSRNGTLLNGHTLDGAHDLAEGDEVQLSGSLLMVRSDRQDSAVVTHDRDLGHTVFKKASELLEMGRSMPPSDRSSVDALQRYSDRLQMLNEVHQAVAQTSDLKTLTDMILARAFEHLAPEEGVILLRTPDGEYREAAHRSLDPKAGPYQISETLVREVADRGLAALVLDVETDERFSSSESIIGSGIRSLIAAPLQDDKGALGLIVLSSNLHRRQFKDGDLEVLTSIAAVAALRIRNVALTAEALERRRMEDELRLARQIQIALLPESLPEVEGYELFSTTVPSRGVSGDFYEIVEREDAEECVIVITDVSGKGVAASLLTASLEALLVGPIESGLPPDQICAQVNRRLFDRTPPAKYATAILAELQPSTGRLRYTNAGHNPALLVRASGQVEQLAPTGTPIGLLPRCEYASADLTMEPGDLLVLYTDGITEAENPAEEEFGLGRLVEVVLAHKESPLDDLADAIEETLDDFADGVPYADDRTVVMTRRRPPA